MTDTSIVPLPFRVEAFLVTVGHQRDVVVYAREVQRPHLDLGAEWEAIIATNAGANIGRGSTALASVEQAVARHTELSAFNRNAPTKKLTLNDLEI